MERYSDYADSLIAFARGIKEQATGAVTAYEKGVVFGNVAARTMAADTLRIPYMSRTALLFRVDEEIEKYNSDKTTPYDDFSAGYREGIKSGLSFVRHFCEKIPPVVTEVSGIYEATATDNFGNTIWNAKVNLTRLKSRASKECLRTPI